MGNIFFERYADMCKSANGTPNSIAKEIGASSGSVTAWKNGAEPRYSTVSKIADRLNTTVDYLLGRTNDPINYDDGELIATIPLSYLEACDGDVRRAYAMMLSADSDVAKEKAPTAAGERSVSDDELKFALWGDCEDVDDDDLADVRRYAAFVRERKKDKK